MTLRFFACAPAITLLLAACAVAPETDGDAEALGGVDTSSDELKSCDLESGCAGGMKLLAYVNYGQKPPKASRTDVTIESTQHGKTPTVVRRFTSGTLRTTKALTAVLTGTNPTDGIDIDNFLLVEILDAATSQRIDAALVGQTNGDKVLLDGKPVRQIGADGFRFAAGAIDLGPMFPQNRAFKLRIMALDNGGFANVSDVFLRVKSAATPPPPPPPPPSSTPFDLATACPGAPITYAQLLSKFAPAASTAVLGKLVMDARQRACQDQTGCAEWQPASSVPFYRVQYTSAYQFFDARALAVPAAATATLSATTSSVGLRIALDGVALEVGNSVQRSASTADFRLNGLTLDGKLVQVGGWSSNSGTFLWFYQDKITNDCLFTTSTGRVYGANGAYTEYQVVFHGTY
jgi:hypothetical protein